MSYIDTIKHEFVGSLNGLPIYHPIETYVNGDAGDYDFSCGPKNLIIGGGGGEHPALVLHELGALVAEYILYSLSQIELYHDCSPWAEEVIDRLDEMSYKERESLEFCDWNMSNFNEFFLNAKSNVHATPLKNSQDAEDWIKLSIGQFVFYSLPELNPYHKEIYDLMEIKEGRQIGYWMNNVVCPPPNHIKSKKQSLSGSSFKEHGFFRWDYRYPPEE